MMLPSFALMRWFCRQSIAMTGASNLGRLTALVTLGYFFVWTLVGLAVFAWGVAIASQSRLSHKCRPFASADWVK